MAVIKAYSTIETKEAVCIGHSGVLFQPDYSGERRGAQKEICYVHIVLRPHRVVPIMISLIAGWS
jgi:hypothetical protein